MRTIKFRGQCLGSKKWVYGSLITSDNGAQIHVTHNDLYAVDPETVGQFTWLFDKNGTEIYEGDIYSHKHYKEVIIVWHDEFCCFCCLTIDDIVKDEYSFCLEDIREYLGNTHDNPELLKNE